MCHRKRQEQMEIDHLQPYSAKAAYSKERLSKEIGTVFYTRKLLGA